MSHRVSTEWSARASLDLLAILSVAGILLLLFFCTRCEQVSSILWLLAIGLGFGTVIRLMVSIAYAISDAMSCVPSKEESDAL